MENLNNGWAKALCIAGGAAATAGLLWYLLREGGDDEEEAGAAAAGASLEGDTWCVTDPKGAAIGIRAGPSVNDQRTGMSLMPGQVFEVSEVKKEEDNTYLRLADGRGWVFTHSSRDGRLLCQPISAEQAEAAQQHSQQQRMMMEMARLMESSPELREQVLNSPELQAMMANPEALKAMASQSAMVGQALHQNTELASAVENDPARLAEALRETGAVKP
eukprot:TRINITY_DN2787_c0_g1_i1.p1 TRINITY_DN2787_c0_g1~~TRINITY_DN2787_c0_g1_i1.p1  ORF type:complete len:219 (-),score=67.45 TRINITY_DN2787_c0_g1_i1:72-728(-)